MKSDPFQPTPLQEAILRYLSLHVGFANRIPRQDLRRIVCAEYMADDRAIRKAIEVLRTMHPTGAYICSTTAGGYFIAETVEELNRYLDQDEKRAKKELGRVHRQRRFAKAFRHPMMAKVIEAAQ